RVYYGNCCGGYSYGGLVCGCGCGYPGCGGYGCGYPGYSGYGYGYYRPSCYGRYWTYGFY
uniref:Keratin associated protein 20-1 n=1 Tax=Equus asinus TaxID=9793 RepID=A0A9L0KAQ8_EQUAS